MHILASRRTGFDSSDNMMIKVDMKSEWSPFTFLIHISSAHYSKENKRSLLHHM